MWIYYNFGKSLISSDLNPALDPNFKKIGKQLTQFVVANWHMPNIVCIFVQNQPCYLPKPPSPFAQTVPALKPTLHPIKYLSPYKFCIWDHKRKLINEVSK